MWKPNSVLFISVVVYYYYYVVDELMIVELPFYLRLLSYIIKLNYFVC